MESLIGNGRLSFAPWPKRIEQWGVLMYSGRPKRSSRTKNDGLGDFTPGPMQADRREEWR
jgi:hypothetical protein